jgi:hypothetical protein
VKLSHTKLIEINLSNKPSNAGVIQKLIRKSMTSIAKSFGVFMILISLLSCDLDTVNGNILVQGNYNGKSVDRAKIYIQSGTRVNPNIPLAQYEIQMNTSADGEAYIKDLIPGDYFIYATGDYQGMISGESSVKIVPRHRLNEYHVTVFMQ